MNRAAEEAAEVLVGAALEDVGAAADLDLVRFVLFSDRLTEAFTRALAAHR